MSSEGFRAAVDDLCGTIKLAAPAADKLSRLMDTCGSQGRLDATQFERAFRFILTSAKKQLEQEAAVAHTAMVQAQEEVAALAGRIRWQAWLAAHEGATAVYIVAFSGGSDEDPPRMYAELHYTSAAAKERAFNLYEGHNRDCLVAPVTITDGAIVLGAIDHQYDCDGLVTEMSLIGLVERCVRSSSGPCSHIGSEEAEHTLLTSAPLIVVSEQV